MPLLEHFHSNVSALIFCRFDLTADALVLKELSLEDRRPWFTDFEWRNHQIVIRKTGIRLKVGRDVLYEIWQWALYLMLLWCVMSWRRITRTPRQSLYFYPDAPRPWYLMCGCAQWMGMQITSSPELATVLVYFDDSTHSAPGHLVMAASINGRCLDISKSHVAEVFANTFGYSLSVDPETSHGEIVEKPEKNGVHGGSIVIAPRSPRPGFTYQRVVDTRNSEECCEDLRTLFANGKPVLVWVKVKTPEGLFSINNRNAYLAEPTAVFSAQELTNIALFTQRMGLDWGGLDILRDRPSGRIYIVDVNKTDLGPVIALSWLDKIKSMDRLGEALDQLITSRARSVTVSSM